jgi:NADP-dependent 3-hydroxy acid dehydrogenase YdfG
VKQLGEIELLVNNAGVAAGDFLDSSPDAQIAAIGRLSGS